MSSSTPRQGPFISYSRRDQDFVRRLYSALQTRDREGWVDWEGILPTEEWMAKIKEAIDGAPAFVFVLSPSSLSSAVCRQEVDHAAAQGKRLIPVVCDDVDAGQAPPAVGKLNWIFIRPQDDFEKQVDLLVGAMDLDLAWISGHSRLLLRAGEWNRAGREPSFLLRGADLKEAEHWLAGAGTSEQRRATDLQAQYIEASRANARRRQRILVASLSAGLLVAVTLAVVAWNQRNTARRQRNLAVSRLLASQSATNAERHLDLALLLAAQAEQMASTSESRAALLAALDRRPSILRYLDGHDHAVSRLAFSASSRRIASFDRANTILVWETESGRTVLSARAETGDEGAWDFSAGGDTIASSAPRGRVALWDIATGAKREIGPFFGESKTTSISFSEDSRLLALGSERGGLAVVDAGTGRAICEKPFPDSAAVRRIWIKGDTAVSLHGWSAYRWPLLQCGTNASQAVQGDRITAAHPALSWLASTQAGPPNLTIASLLTGELTEFRPRYSDFSTALSVAHNGLVAIGTRAGEIRLWDSTSSDKALLQRHAAEISSVAFNPTGTQLVSGSVDGDVILWDLKERPDRQPVAFPTKDLIGLAHSKDATRIAVLGSNGALSFRRTSDWQLAGPELELKIEPVGIASSGEGTFAVAAVGVIVLVDWESMSEIQRLPIPGAAVDAVAVDAAGGRVVFGDGEQVAVWDRSSRSISKTFRVPQNTGDKKITAVAISSNGSLLAVGGFDNRIHVFRAGDWSEVAMIPAANEKYVRSIAFHPGGHILASGGGMYDGAVSLWDIATATRLLPPIRTDEVDVTQVRFNRQGDLLAAVSFVGGVTLWDVASGRQIAKFSGRGDGPVRGRSVVSFGPTELAVSTRQGAFVWSVNPAEWIRQACRVANRNLTRQEWLAIGSEIEYEKTCPDLP